MGAARALEKLRNIVGPTQADEIVSRTMRGAAVTNLDDPNELAKFAEELMKSGGVLAAIGNAIKIQAILEGAQKSIAPRAPISGVSLKAVHHPFAPPEGGGRKNDD